MRSRERVTLRSRALRKLSTLLSARLDARVRDRALELREDDRRALELRELDRRALEARELLDLRLELRELRRRDDERPEPFDICVVLLGWLACPSRLSHRFERE
jgi:hypothetical protein